MGESTRQDVATVSQAILLRRPGLFLGLFALVTALSLPVWDVLSSYYMHGVIWIVNGGLSLFGPAVRLPSTLVREGVYPGIAGAIALFLVTPRRSFVWKLRWITFLMMIMLVVHAGILLAGAMQAIHGSQAVYGSLASASLPLRLLQTWGTSLFVIWIWFVALQRHDEERSALHERSDPQERSQD
jgi:hypothetical protein